MSAVEREPTPGELAAIEAGWPLVVADLAVVDALIDLAGREGPPSECAWRRLARAWRHADATARLTTIRPAVRRPARSA